MKLAIVIAGFAVALALEGPAYAWSTPAARHAQLAGFGLDRSAAVRPLAALRVEQHGGHGGGARGRTAVTRGPGPAPMSRGVISPDGRRRIVFPRRIAFFPFAYSAFGFGFWPYDAFWWGAGGYPYAWGYPYGWGYGAYGGYGGYGPGYGDGAYASLRLDVKPKNAEVLVDGYYVGQVSDFDGSYHHLDVEAGAHRVEIRAPGYEPLTLNINLMAGRTVSYRGELKSGSPGTARDGS